MRDKITILMATYNGEKFLTQQIESIINQTYHNWELIISDDASKDQTISIINKYSKEDKRITLYENKLNSGQVKNFNRLLGLNTDAEYIMFADQDDIWLDDKVEITLKEMKKQEREGSRPILVYTDLQYVDYRLNPIRQKKINKTNDILLNLLMYNFIWGCTMMINKSLRDLIYPISEKAENHDYWIALHAALEGEIYYINKKTMLYRQHSTNVTGGINNSKITSKIKKINQLKYKYDKSTRQNICFCLNNKHNSNSALKVYLTIYGNKKSRINMFITMIKYRFRKNSILETITYYLYTFMRKEND